MIISAFAKLSQRLLEPKSDEFYASIKAENSWFDKVFVDYSLLCISDTYCKKNIESFLKCYSLDYSSPKKVGLITAGNIPLVGIHDIFCVLISGNHLFIKPSSKDLFLTKIVLTSLIEFEPSLKERITICSKEDMHQCPIIIATGSDVTATSVANTYKNQKLLIRQHRTSIAVIENNCTDKNLEELADDLFLYYGLGCRNVSKIYIPQTFDISRFNKVFEKYSFLNQNENWFANYKYQKALLKVNDIEYIDFGFALLCESNSLFSPISLINYEKYQSIEEIQYDKNKIQCVVSTNNIPFGKAQHPEINDFADGVDTILVMS